MSDLLPVLAAIGLLPLLTVIWLAPAAQILTWLLPASRSGGSQTSGGLAAPRFLFIVPAHDEERHIRRCVESLTSQDCPDGQVQVLVIADNCSDQTATLAREGGAICLERQDPEAPGKPHAIAWALERTPLDRYDICVVVDADTVTDPGFARGVAAAFAAQPEARAVQAYNAIANENASWLTRLAGLHMRLRYEVQYPRRCARGLNCPLTGNGMCFRADLLAERGWKAFAIAENWELYAQYTAAGLRIGFAPDSMVRAFEASALSRAGTQRKRWMAGRLAVARDYLGEILRSEKIGLLQKLDALGELATPSPVIHAVLVAAIAAPLIILLGGREGILLSSVAMASLLPTAVETGLALRSQPRPVRTLASLAMIPFYAVWRSVKALETLVVLSRMKWTRSEREDDRESPAHS